VRAPPPPPPPPPPRVSYAPPRFELIDVHDVGGDMRTIDVHDGDNM